VVVDVYTSEDFISFSLSLIFTVPFQGKSSIPVLYPISVPARKTGFPSSLRKEKLWAADTLPGMERIKYRERTTKTEDVLMQGSNVHAEAKKYLQAGGCIFMQRSLGNSLKDSGNQQKNIPRLKPAPISGAIPCRPVRFGKSSRAIEAA